MGNPNVIIIATLPPMGIGKGVNGGERVKMTASADVPRRDFNSDAT